MFRTKATLAFVPLALLTLGAVAPAQDTVAETVSEPLRVKLTAGTTAWFKANVSSKQSIDMDIQQMEVGSTMEWVFSVQVLEAAADAAAQPVEFHLVALKGRADLPMVGASEFDSHGDEADDNSVGSAMRTLVGTRFRATVTDRGEVKVVDDLSETFEEAMDAAGGMEAQMLMGVLNMGTIQQLAEGVFPMVPEEPHKVGDKWQQTDKAADGPAPVTSKLEFTLAELSAKSAKVSLTGTIEVSSADDVEVPDGVDAEAAEMAKQMMKDMKINASKIAGHVVWSRVDGMVSDSQRNVEMDMSMPGPLGGDMTIKQVQTIKVARGTAEDAKKPKAAEDKAGK